MPKPGTFPTKTRIRGLMGRLLDRIDQILADPDMDLSATELVQMWSVLRQAEFMPEELQTIRATRRKAQGSFGAKDAAKLQPQADEKPKRGRPRKKGLHGV